jgi:hypothetical protein
LTKLFIPFPLTVRLMMCLRPWQQVSKWHEKQYQKTGGPTIGEKQKNEAASELKMANQSVHGEEWFFFTKLQLQHVYIYRYTPTATATRVFIS